MARHAAEKDRLTASVASMKLTGDENAASVRIVVEPVRFVKLKAVTAAALDYAVTAVNISIGLIGVMALWLGVMKVAEEAGLLRVITRLLAPLTRRLFPDVPQDHPALAAMIMNIAANMLGLNNAATPMGLKAMEELNRLNPRVGTATNAMVTFPGDQHGGGWSSSPRRQSRYGRRRDRRIRGSSSGRPSSVRMCYHRRRCGLPDPPAAPAYRRQEEPDNG